MISRRNPNHRRGGFTLFEVLAVVVVLSMVAGVLTTHFAAPTEAARRDATIALILDLDARARLAAKSNGGAVLALDSDRCTVRLTTRNGSLVSEMGIDPAMELRLRTVGPDAKIRFEGSGRSPSYRVEWNDRGRVRRIAICGATGWSEEGSP